MQLSDSDGFIDQERSKEGKIFFLPSLRTAEGRKAQSPTMLGRVSQLCERYLRKRMAHILLTRTSLRSFTLSAEIGKEG